MDEFEHPKGVLDLFRFPGIPTDHRDAENMRLRRLEQEHHGHLI
jgi:hypothetical protein